MKFEFYTRDDEGVQMEIVSPDNVSERISNMLEYTILPDGTKFDITNIEHWRQLPAVYCGSRFWIRISNNEEEKSMKMKMKMIYKGGKGSGHFEHEGRPGKHGGSLPSDEHHGKTDSDKRAERADKRKIRRAQADEEEAARRRDARGVAKARYEMSELRKSLNFQDGKYKMQAGRSIWIKNDTHYEEYITKKGDILEISSGGLYLSSKGKRISIRFTEPPDSPLDKDHGKGYVPKDITKL